MVERQSPKLEVRSSILRGGVFFFVKFTQSKNIALQTHSTSAFVVDLIGIFVAYTGLIEEKLQKDRDKDGYKIIAYGTPTFSRVMQRKDCETG